MARTAGGSKKEVPAPEAASAANKSSHAQPIQNVLLFLLAFRLANALCVRTFFQPDEYFQALEPAWQTTYGAGSGAWMTWEWTYQLRSSLHPMLFSLGYSLAEKALGLLQLAPQVKTEVLVLMPKLIQSVFAALGDWYTWKLASKLYGTASVTTACILFMTIANPWHWYCSTRTFSNSLEMTITIMALHYFPWELVDSTKHTKDSKPSAGLVLQTASLNSLRLSLILAATAVILRPTNVFIWLATAAIVVTRFPLEGASLLPFTTYLVLAREAIFCGLSVLGLSVLADYLFFQKWTFPPYNWLHFNLAQSLSVFYGVNDWHYYLSQGIPLTSTTLAPFVFYGIWVSLSSNSAQTVATKNALRTLSYAVITTMGALSLVTHKEVRFVYPLLPVFHILAAPHVVNFFTTASPSTSVPPLPSLQRTHVLIGAIIVNITIGTYLASLHSAAPIQVMTYLRSEFERLHPSSLATLDPSSAVSPSSEALELFAFFLIQCHSTPWRSHLVYPALRARALTCEPPLHTAPGSPERAAYQEESSRFFADPLAFIDAELWPADGKGGEALPRYIVGFEGVRAPLEEYFGPGGRGAGLGVKLNETWSAWNGLFTDDDRKAGRLIVWDTGLYPYEQ